jgi:hypothetical protein
VLGAQYVTLDNKIKCLSLAGFFFGDPTNKTVTGTAYAWGLLIAKPPGPIIMIDQSEILSGNQVSIYYTLFGLQSQFQSYGWGWEKKLVTKTWM